MISDLLVLGEEDVCLLTFSDKFLIPDVVILSEEDQIWPIL